MSLISTDLIINKRDLSDAKYVESELPAVADLLPEQAILKIATFAVTANNITYAVTGDAFRYWDFFPTAEEGWGRVPVWGFADVVASTTDGVAVGDRVYGYFPMSTYLLVTPGQVSERGFMDVAEHRQKLSPIYNQYSNVSADPGYQKSHEGLISLFRPLFTTSFLLDDYQAENEFFGAQSVILSSASSKTAIGTAFLLARRDENISVVGLTSKSNVSFVESLGCYDTVVAYEDLESLPVAPSNFIDMAGNGNVLSRVHTHFGDNLKDSSLVGATHWQARSRQEKALAGPKPALFFAPSYAQERIKVWGMGGFQKRIGAVWVEFVPSTASWISVNESAGKDAVMGVYQGLLANTLSPTQGYIVSVWD